MSQITIQDLSFTYEGDHVPVFQHLDLQLDTRWKLGLVGRNGRGKTTLLRLLEGSLSGGGVLTRPDRTIYFPRLVAEPERPAREILLEGIPWEEEWMLLRELNRLGLDEDILNRPFSSLSGGEQTRAGLARPLQGGAKKKAGAGINFRRVSLSRNLYTSVTCFPLM